MLSRRSVLAAVVTAPFAFSALAGEATLDSTGGQPAAKAITIGYSQCNRGEPWREQMDKDIKASAAKHSEIKLIAKDAQNEALRQIGHVREFVSQKVDVLIISPKDTSLTPAIADAFKAGIPVIILDRKVEGDQYTCFIGADNRVIGEQVGKWIVKTLGGKDKAEGGVVELQGLSSTIAAKDRSEPFREAIKDTKLKIVYDADMEWLSDKAREKMQAALARNAKKGSIKVVYGANDPAAIAAYNAAKDAGREKEMIFVGVDALPHEGVQAVKSGMLAATFEYPNGAAEAIDAAIKLSKGEKVEKTITLGTRLFTKENVDKGGEAIPAK